MKFLIIYFEIILLFIFCNCNIRESQADKYQKAKIQTEKKIEKLFKIITPGKKEISEENRKKYNEIVAMRKIKYEKKIIKLIKEIYDDSNKVFKLKPKGFEDDYKIWYYNMKKKVESL